MKTLFSDKCVTVSYSRSSKALQIEWHAVDGCLSQTELNIQFEMLYAILDSFKIQIVYIDAYDMDCRHLTNIADRIKVFFNGCSANIIGLVINPACFKNGDIDENVRQLVRKQLDVIFHSKEEGKHWFAVLKTLVRCLV